MDLGIATASITRILNAHWADVVASTTPDLLPVNEARGRKAKAFTSYGCGHYGCVFPTSRPNVVLKITTDPSEAEFVKTAMQIGRWPDGIVVYYQIKAIGDTYRGRGVHLIWREEAHNIGEWSLPFNRDIDEYTKRVRRDFSHRLRAFKEHAHLFRAYTQHGAKIAEISRYKQWAWNAVDLNSIEGVARFNRWKGAQAAAAHLRACEVLAEMMANEPEGYLVGQALDFYLERGLLLADVHANNVGEVTRDGYSGPILVITDPGHLVRVP